MAARLACLENPWECGCLIAPLHAASCFILTVLPGGIILESGETEAQGGCILDVPWLLARTDTSVTTSLLLFSCG